MREIGASAANPSLCALTSCVQSQCEWDLETKASLDVLCAAVVGVAIPLPVPHHNPSLLKGRQGHLMPAVRKAKHVIR